MKKKESSGDNDALRAQIMQTRATIAMLDGKLIDCHHIAIDIDDAFRADDRPKLGALIAKLLKKSYWQPFCDGIQV